MLPRRYLQLPAIGSILSSFVSLKTTPLWCDIVAVAYTYLPTQASRSLSAADAPAHMPHPPTAVAFRYPVSELTNRPLRVQAYTGYQLPLCVRST
ncbi:hypothetical protein LMH87_003872 [Akanthomyces muscarius]|uniref:Uncharacterized protein n=1 Tax=Akanthomyces muscarius TaxID=2231603 RepID=A0A9W8Q4I1_AKAMU|nr:hypothetical protein LMH87_003872 [Akanthomyces muscarius]KAJ4145007.1 hypothetical protein LMH87_003872 [Akanthomyces muscarius]